MMISFKRKLINFRCKIQLDHLVGSAQLYLKDRPPSASAIDRDAHNNKPTSFCRRPPQSPPPPISSRSSNRTKRNFKEKRRRRRFLRPISLSLSLASMRAKDNGGSFRRLFAPFQSSLPPRISIRLRGPRPSIANEVC